MNKNIYIVLVAQFFSSLADNALLYGMIALLAQLHKPEWHFSLLREFFAIAYVLLAPCVGLFADAFSKGRVMFFSNGIKFLGALSVLFGTHPLLAYAIVGVGSAIYSPAKYGILPEILETKHLIKGNAWIEGTTVISIISGPLLGGWLTQDNVLQGILWITLFYFFAAIANYYIPYIASEKKINEKNLLMIFSDFKSALAILWRDREGKLSLLGTTLFWSTGATLQFVVLKWAEVQLHLSEIQTGILLAILACGIAIGALLADRYIKIEKTHIVLSAGIIMGSIVMTMTFVYDVKLAQLLLLVIGVLAGFFLVPLNALLQYRGHILVGTGHSIAIQNLIENIGILILIGLYTVLIGAHINLSIIILAFGGLIVVLMTSLFYFFQIKSV